MKVKYLLIILNINYAYISYIIVYKIYVLNKFLYIIELISYPGIVVYILIWLPRIGMMQRVLYMPRTPLRVVRGNCSATLRIKMTCICNS